MRYPMWIGCVLCVLCGIGASFGYTALAPATNLDCVLMTYDDSCDTTMFQEAESVAREAEQVASDLHTRVIVYPRSFTPILIPQGKVSAIRKQLGTQMLVLSPELH